MGQNSSIEWTDHTFNPWWGCTKISPGCVNCYAATFAFRYGTNWGPEADRKTNTDKYWNEPLKWNAKATKEGKRQKVFCASMADVFEDNPQVVKWRNRLWELIKVTPMLDWLLLTKRPENVTKMVLRSWLSEWPDNIWLGTSVENQAMADWRWPRLLENPAKIRFLSVEPLLEPVTLNLHGIDWVIVGGESGKKFRPFNPDWARSIRDQCRKKDVAFFMKQLGGVYGGSGFEKLPQDLQIRQFPWGHAE